MPEAIVALGEGKRIVGRLRFESDGRRQHSQFEYDAAWLVAEDRFALAPGLPLRDGSHFSSGKDDKRSRRTQKCSKIRNITRHRCAELLPEAKMNVFPGDVERRLEKFF